MAVEVRLLDINIPVVVDTNPDVLMYVCPAPFTKGIRFEYCALEYPASVLEYCRGVMIYESIPLTVDVSCEREIYFTVPRPSSVEINVLLNVVLRSLDVVTKSCEKI
jgi:hypothetical protein